MKVLLDTNIIIHREASSIVNREIGVLFKWLDKLHYIKCIHPTTIQEINKHKDEKVRSAMNVKLDSYEQLKTQSSIDQIVQSLSDKVDKTENDLNDTLILNEIYAERVDYLITEDKKIHEKGKFLNISDKIFRINSFLEKVHAENPDLIDYKVLSVKKEYFSNININDPFFDSFKDDYVGFEQWFNKKANEVAYICQAEDKSILAFLYIKVEDRNENYADIRPIFTRKKRLKIGTFKIISNGFKLGERFLKIIFDNALINKVDEIYVTIFNKTFEQQMLVSLLNDWGFYEYGIKETQSGNEFVYVRDFSKNVNKLKPKKTFPFITKNTNFFIVPIFPKYHTNLFPDSILRTESPKDFVENEPHRNAISKVYISRSFERRLQPSDIIVFYRTAVQGQSAYYSSVISTIGIVESVVTNIKNAEEFISLCRKRSVFTDDELRKHWDYNTKSQPFIVNFLYLYSLNKRLTRKDLIDSKVFVDGYAPRGFDKISKEKFELIIKESKSDGSFIID